MVLVHFIRFACVLECFVMGLSVVVFLEGLKVVVEGGKCWGFGGVGCCFDCLYSHINWVTPWGSIEWVGLSVGAGPKLCGSTVFVGVRWIVGSSRLSHDTGVALSRVE